MLNEEAFLLVVLLFACGLLGLGTLEMVWPTQPRHPLRRYSRDPWRRARPRGAAMPLAAVAAPSIPAPLPVAEPTPFLTQLEAAELEATDLEATARIEATTEIEPTPEPVVAADAARAIEAEPPPLLVEDVGLASTGAKPLAETSESAAGDRPVDERCFALLEDQRFAEVVRLAEAHLQVRKAAGPLVPSAEATRETARLWGAVGLAKQGLDDLDGARFAFEEAIALAPQTERLTWERNLAALAVTSAQRSLDAEAADPVSPERIESIRSAIDWLGRGLAVSPDDPALRDTLVAAREAFWLANEAMVKLLIKQKHLAEARRRLDDVMMDPECPPARQRAFRVLWGRALGSEVGQTVTAAVRHLQKGREDDAIVALARAESAMAQIAADALPTKRRQELERRLWWAYMKLGVVRRESGAHEDAMSPLFQALAFTDIGAECQEQTHATLVQTLEELVAVRSANIGALIDAGDTAAAAIQGDKLWSLLRSAVDQGLPQEHLTDTFGKITALFQKMGGPERAPID